MIKAGIETCFVPLNIVLWLIACISLWDCMANLTVKMGCSHY